MVKYKESTVLTLTITEGHNGQYSDLLQNSLSTVQSSFPATLNPSSVQQIKMNHNSGLSWRSALIVFSFPFSANSEWSACSCSVFPRCQKWGVSALGSPEGPSSASGWCVATVVACTWWEASSPWPEPSPWKAAVCGADAWSVCSLRAHLRSEEQARDRYIK